MFIMQVKVVSHFNSKVSMVTGVYSRTAGVWLVLQTIEQSRFYFIFFYVFSMRSSIFIFIICVKAWLCNACNHGNVCTYAGVELGDGPAPGDAA
jgi:hypothetical protein